MILFADVMPLEDYGGNSDTGGPGANDGSGVIVWDHVCVNLRACCGGDAGDVVDVFEAHGDAVQSIWRGEFVRPPAGLGDNRPGLGRGRCV